MQIKQLVNSLDFDDDDDDSDRLFNNLNMPVDFINSLLIIID